MPTTRTISDIKAKLLRPATTSHFEVEIPIIPALKSWRSGDDQDRIQLMCSEASLPGSNLATFDINNDRTGVTEKHVHRRIFDDRIDLTFYVDAGVYRPIQFFENWMDYITNPAEEAIQVPAAPLQKEDPNYFYRMRYPQEPQTGYVAQQGLIVRKFEKDVAYGGDGKEKGRGTRKVAGGGALEYKFINTFPLAINSMPVSYEASSLLKFTVSMSYIRYVVNHISTPRDDGGLQEVKKGRNKDSKSFATFNTENLAGNSILPAGDIPYVAPPLLTPPYIEPPVPPSVAQVGPGRAWGQRSDGTFGLI